MVNQDNTDVHAYYWDKSTVVGQLKKGDPVLIRQERGQWYRIAAPESARAYVFAEYVRIDGGLEVAADSAPPPVNPAIDLSQGQPDATGRLKMSENDRRTQALKEAYFKRIQEQYAREEETISAAVEQVFSGIDDLEAKIKAIDAEVASKISYPAATTELGSAAWAPPDPLYGGYTGWVENIGRVGGAPASFRLSKGGEIRFYLRSDRFSLADFSGRRVWVNGNIETDVAGSVLNVEQLRLLSDQEIAEGMRQFDPSLYRGASQDAFPQGGTEPVPNSRYQAAPSDPSMLPDVVGIGQSNPYSGLSQPGITGSGGEVETDYYENPAISEIGPDY
ncbi:MAG: SH3 domain-containing protein [Planctomycetota bacterium]|nr:SH3 domain-containing protein [Planctomycetota bacterium]